MNPMVSAKIFNKKLAAARDLLSKKCYGEAERLYIELQQYGQERELILNELVRVYWLAGKVKQAIGSLERLTQLSPDNLGYYLDLIRVCEQSGHLSKSLEGYQRLLQIKVDLPNTWYNYARLLKRVGRSQDSLDAYRQALNFGVASPEEVYNNIAVIFSEMRREPKAISALEEAIKLNSNYIPARFNLGGLYEESGNTAKAVEQYRRILSLDPDHFPALCRIANMPDASGNSSELLREVERALEKPDLEASIREELLFAYGKLLDECQRFGEAFKSYREANELGRKRFAIYDKDDQEKKVEKIIDSFDRDWFSGGRGNADVTPIFICGMYRSGSTLIEQILSGHPKITAGGELDYFPKLAKTLQLSSGDIRISNEYIDSTAEDYLNYLSQRFGRFDLVTDKRPDNFMNLGLIKTIFPGSRVIWTQRGLLDNCLSIYFQYLGGDMNYSVDLDSIGHYYAQQVRLMNYWSSLFPETIYPVSYEKLVESPEREVRALLDFLGLEWDEACLNVSRRENRVKTASIWQVRQPIYKKARTHYKNYMRYLGELDKYKYIFRSY